MKKEKIPLQESKSHKENIKPIFSQWEQSLFMGIVFESQTEKKVKFKLYMCIMPSSLKRNVQIIVRGHMVSGNLKAEFKNLAIQSLFLPHFSVTGY